MLEDENPEADRSVASLNLGEKGVFIKYFKMQSFEAKEMFLLRIFILFYRLLIQILLQNICPIILLSVSMIYE